jgi:putative heme iron utilization protein
MEGALVIATEDNTEIRVNNEVVPVATLNTGQYFMIPDSKYQLQGADIIIYTLKQPRTSIFIRFLRVQVPQEMKWQQADLILFLL